MLKENLEQLDEKLGAAFSDLGKEQVRFTERDILFIHDDRIRKYGGAYGIRDHGLFHSACEMPYQEVFGTELYPTPYEKAARYLFCFSNYQIFVDGNKRTGLAVAGAYLLCNGISLDLTNTEAYNLTMDIANHYIEDIKDIAAYLEIHSHMEHQNELEEENDEPELD